MVVKVQSHWLGTNLVIGIWVQNVGWQHGWASKIVIKSHPHPLPTAKAGHGHVDVRRVQLCYNASDWLAVAMAAVFTLQLFLFCCCSFPCSFSSLVILLLLLSLLLIVCIYCLSLATTAVFLLSGQPKGRSLLNLDKLDMQLNPKSII